MVLWNLGSVATEVLTLVDNVPTSISGALLGIADRKRVFSERYTNLTIGSTAIAEDYQAAILYLTIADVTGLMELQGVDATSYSLGDLSLSKGKGSNTDTTSDKFEALGMKELEQIGNRIGYEKANG